MRRGITAAGLVLLCCGACDEDPCLQVLEESTRSALEVNTNGMVGSPAEELAACTAVATAHGGDPELCYAFLLPFSCIADIECPNADLDETLLSLSRYHDALEAQLECLESR